MTLDAMPPPEFFGALDDEPANDASPPSSRVALETSETWSDPWMLRVQKCLDVWFTTTPPKRHWLLRDARADDAGVLPLGKVGLLIAEGGIGKTMVAFQLALSVASHDPLPWLGCFAVPEQGRVLMLLGEEDYDEVVRRSYNARRSLGASIPEPGSIVVLPLAGVPCSLVEKDERGNLFDAPLLFWIRSYMKHHGPFALVVIDPLSRFAGTDAEIDNAAATRFIQAAESIAKESGATVLIAHHTNKSSRGTGATVSGASARGASAIFDGVRWACTLSSERIDSSEVGAAQPDELVTLSIVKSNYSRKGAAVTLRRDNENGGALVPITAAEWERISLARMAADPATRRREARDESSKAQTSKIADTIVAILSDAPDGLPYRGLRAAVQARLGSCSDPKLNAALASLDAVQTRPGANRSTVHFLASEASR